MRRMELDGTPGAYRLRLQISRSESGTGGFRRMLDNQLGELEWKRELK